jgi:hypothetical protein
MLCRSLRFAALMFVLTSPALAVDGVLEINHICATTTGCFAGDSSRYPVTISAPGSYRLTSNLAVPDENTSAIRVEASSVSIDLNGFEIAGITTCPGLPPLCVSTGLGSGVEVDDAQRESVSVRNGSIRGMGRAGVILGALALVENVRVRENGFLGIALMAAHGAVRHCQAQSNGSFGITASGAVVYDNVASVNGQYGIAADGTLSGNVANLNAAGGISAGANATVIGNSADGNRGHGITAAWGATIVNNTASDNAVLLGPPVHGISCGSGCTVRGNTAHLNSGYGLSLGANSAYGENTLVDNGQGGASGGVSTGGNYCAGPGVGLASCP